ncbi:MAG: hypothetical protein ACI9JT_002247, partial [Polaribacter sp.]
WIDNKKEFSCSGIFYFLNNIFLVDTSIKN